MSKHTQGPWKAVPQAVVDAVEMFEIAQVSHFVVVSDAGELWPSKQGAPEDDARLIAAAPGLLEFAQEWLSRQGTDENYMVARARAAIAKATGEAA